MKWGGPASATRFEAMRLSEDQRSIFRQETNGHTANVRTGNRDTSITKLLTCQRAFRYLIQMSPPSRCRIARISGVNGTLVRTP